MNKRQAKKEHKKVIYPLIDEFNLLTLNEEEYKQAMKEFYEYAYKHLHYKHYRDKNKPYIKNHIPIFSFPVGKAFSEYITKTIVKNIFLYIK